MEIAAYSPTPDSWFPSITTPIEQIAKYQLNEIQSMLNIHFISDTPIAMSGIPAYHLSYSGNDERLGNSIEDEYMIINGDKLYNIIFTTSKSSYDQNKLIRDDMISSMVLGDNYDDSIIEHRFENILGQNLSRYEDALNYKGDALVFLGNYTEALEYYDKALAIDPTDIDTLNNKGDVLGLLGNHTAAIEYYDKAKCEKKQYDFLFHSYNFGSCDYLTDRIY